MLHNAGLWLLWFLWWECHGTNQCGIVQFFLALLYLSLSFSLSHSSDNRSQAGSCSTGRQGERAWFHPVLSPSISTLRLPYKTAIYALCSWLWLQGTGFYTVLFGFEEISAMKAIFHSKQAASFMFEVSGKRFQTFLPDTLWQSFKCELSCVGVISSCCRIQN